MLTEADQFANRMAGMGKGEADKIFGVVRIVVPHSGGRGIEMVLAMPIEKVLI